jgi:hypothetical protein
MTCAAEKDVSLVSAVALITFDLAQMAIMRIRVETFGPFGHFGVRDMAEQALHLGYGLLFSASMALLARDTPCQVPVSRKCSLLLGAACR